MLQLVLLMLQLVLLMLQLVLLITENGDYNYIIMGVCHTQKAAKGNGLSDVSAKTQEHFYTSSSNRQQPELYCPRAHSIQNMCISKKCVEQALFCSQGGCSACQKAHAGCECVKLSEVVRLINKRSKQNQQFVFKIAQLEKELIEKIKQRMNAHLEKALAEEVNHKYGQLIDAVYFKKSEISFQGLQAEEFFSKLKEIDARRADFEQTILSNFKQQIQKIALSLNTLQGQAISQYIKKSKITLEANKKHQPSERQSDRQPQKQSDRQPQKQSDRQSQEQSERQSQEQSERQSQEQSERHSLRRSELALGEIQFITRTQPKPSLDSKIVHPQMLKQAQFIVQALNNPKAIQLVFRASEHEFKASSFHQFCDNIPHTLTLVKTQFGRTIVGYTPLTWNAATGIAADQTQSSFLLSLDLHKKMSLVRAEKAIQCIPSYGPVFGGGSDIAVADQCHTSRKSCTNFPYSYNCQEEFIYGQESWEALCGVQAGKYFNVTEYEVFRVGW